MAEFAFTFFGRFQVLRAGKPLNGFTIDKTRALLAYLAAARLGNGQSDQDRATLAQLLWPGYAAESARTNLRQTLQRLRQALVETNAEDEHVPCLQITRQTIGLTPGTYAADVLTFTALLNECTSHLHSRLWQCQPCLTRLRQAADLYTGDFLADLVIADSEPFEEWRRVLQEQFHLQALDLLGQLAGAAEAAGDDEGVRTYALRQLALEPWLETAHRQVMRALARQGQRAAAVAQYHTCRQVLAEELGAQPEAETVTLYEQVRSGEFAQRATASAHPVTMPSVPLHQLPIPVTPLIGRARELAELNSRLHEPGERLLTLIGPGGMGKTRLALEVGQAQQTMFADGVVFVPLASLGEATGLAMTIATALGLNIQGADPRQTLRDALRPRRLLLILDNFEHLLAGTQLVVDLLQAAPNVQILVTSRERLNVRGEQVYVVQPMAFVQDGTLVEAASTAAVRLFVQSARRTQANFVLDETNLPGVLRICALVQGMPLGLELAAAWTEMLAPAEIASEIEKNVDFLAVDWPDAPARQRSLRAVFDWSWHLLKPAEQQVLRQLSSFRGGFTRAAAEPVAGASLRLLTSLVQKSLLRRSDPASPMPGRYDFHELLRQFAAEQLNGIPEERAAVDRRHSDYYLQFVAVRTQRLARNEPRQAAAELRGEIDNIRQAWAWAARHSQLTTLAASAVGLWQFYLFENLIAEGERALHLAAECLRTESVAATHPPSPEAQRLLSNLLALRAYLLIARVNHPETIPLAQQAVDLGQASGGIEGAAMGHLAWGYGLSRQAQYAEARAHLAQAIELAQHQPTPADDPAALELLYEVEWISHSLLRGLDRFADDYPGAIAHGVQALQRCQALGKLRGEMSSLTWLADLFRKVHDYPAARSYGERALLLARSLDYRWGEGLSQLNLSHVTRLLGEYTLAHTMGEGAFTIFCEVGDHGFAALAAVALGQLQSYLGNRTAADAWFREFWRELRQFAVPEEEIEMEGLLPLALHCHHNGEASQALAYVAKAWQTAQRHGWRRSQAYALLVSGHVLVGLQRQAEAREAYGQALVLCQNLNNTPFAVEALAGLAQIALAQSDLSLAQKQVEEILHILVDQPAVGLDEPFFAYLTCYQVLAATHDPRARAVLQTAHTRLQSYAAHIGHEEIRQSFLQNVAIHRQLVVAYAQEHST